MKQQMQKVTVPIAAALVLTVVDKIEKINAADQSKKTASFRKSGAYKNLQKMYKEKEQLMKRYSLIENQFERKFGVSVYHSGGRLSIDVRRKPIPSTRTLKTELIIANAVEGVPINKVVDYVVAKHTKKK
jgi:hypothetical protein